EIVGAGELVYLPPLYQFPFGVSVCDERNAFEPRRWFSEKLLELLPIIVPASKDISRNELYQLVRKQVNAASAPLFFLMRLGRLLIVLLRILCFGSNSRLTTVISRTRLFYVFTFPLNMVLINAVYCSEEHMRQCGQHVPGPGKSEPA